jgi:hypothetical protein
MIALTVVDVKFSTKGTINGSSVSIGFQGNLIANSVLSGNLSVKYTDDNEVNFTINTKAE